MYILYCISIYSIENDEINDDIIIIDIMDFSFCTLLSSERLVRKINGIENVSIYNCSIIVCYNTKSKVL